MRTLIISAANTSVDTPRQHHAETTTLEAFIDLEGSDYRDIDIVWTTVLLTDEEAAAIEQKLDNESSEGRLAFGSAEELDSFLRSQIDRTDE